MALALLITFSVLAIVGRVVLQYRMTGDHGIRPANKSSVLPAKISSAILLISFLVFWSIAIMDWFHPVNLSSQSQFFRFPGFALGIFGIAITVISQHQMGKSWRVGVRDEEKTQLVKNGLYAYVRHPIYTGVLVFATGLLCVAPNVFTLAALMALLVSIEIQVRYVEEPYLEKHHGQEYKVYALATGRYLPRFHIKPNACPNK